MEISHSRIKHIEKACYENDLESLKKLINISTYRHTFIFSCNLDRVDIIKFLIEDFKDINKITLNLNINLILNRGLFYACRDNNKFLVDLFIQKGVYDFNYGLQGACQGHHIDLVDLMIEKGATSDKGLIGACKGNHRDLVDLMIEKGTINFNEGLLAACAYENVDMCKLMIEKGATTFKSCFSVACSRNLDIVKLILEKREEKKQQNIEMDLDIKNGFNRSLLTRRYHISDYLREIGYNYKYSNKKYNKYLIEKFIQKKCLKEYIKSLPILIPDILYIICQMI